MYHVTYLHIIYYGILIRILLYLINVLRDNNNNYVIIIILSISSIINIKNF